MHSFCYDVSITRKNLNISRHCGATRALRPGHSRGCTVWVRHPTWFGRKEGDLINLWHQHISELDEATSPGVFCPRPAFIVLSYWEFSEFICEDIHLELWTSSNIMPPSNLYNSLSSDNFPNNFAGIAFFSLSLSAGRRKLVGEGRPCGFRRCGFNRL